MASQPHIAAFYRVVLLYIEPFLATYGAVMATRSPLLYLSVMDPRANLSHYHPEIQVLFDQLAGCYFLFAFNQAIVLRVADGQLRVWRAMVAGMLACDIIHMRATGRAMGWAAHLDPLSWRFFDAFNLIVLYGVAAMRIAFLAGVGVVDGDEGQQQQQQGKQTTGMTTRSKTKTG